MKETTVVNFNNMDVGCYMATPLETHFMQSLSALFSAGESYFSRSCITCASGHGWLFQLAKEFAKQEFYHSRYHERLNNATKYEDDILNRIDKHLDKTLKKLSQVLPKEVNLSATVILEEVTARLGKMLLTDKELNMRFADSDVHELWIAHATDEVAHKYVAETIQSEIFGVRGKVLNFVLRPLVKTILVLVVAKVLVLLNTKSGDVNEIGDYIPFTKMVVKFLKSC